MNDTPAQRRHMGTGDEQGEGMMETATLRMIGEYEKTATVEPGIDAGWFVLLTDDDEANDWTPRFIYDSNTITLFDNGNEVPYGAYDLEFS